MKTTLFATILLFSVTYASAQPDVIKWKFSSTKIAAGVYQVKLSANLQNGWHIYSLDPGEGPVPTTVSFTKSPVVQLLGKTSGIGKLKTEESEIFNSKIKYYENTLVLLQTVRVRPSVKTVLKGNIEYMVCDKQQCRPPKTTSFSISL